VCVCGYGCVGVCLWVCVCVCFGVGVSPPLPFKFLYRVTNFYETGMNIVSLQHTAHLYAVSSYRR